MARPTVETERSPSPDADDDDFNDIYQEYTGPPRPSVKTEPETVKGSKKSQASSDEEEETRDPNAVPTDFTSREAKVWEAKSKATERNWKKRKEEEMICKLCGDPGHFTQGCPTTLGANHKSQDFFERVPSREKNVKALFTEKVIRRIESDNSCKIKVEEKFIIVSGKDRLCMKKGVDAVHKVKEEGDKGDKGGSSSRRSRSRSPDRNRTVSRRSRSRSPDRNRNGSRAGRSESQRSLSSPRNSLPPRLSRQEKVVEYHVREDLQQLARGSAQAYGSEGARGRSSHSKSPARPGFSRNAFNPYDDNSQSIGSRKIDGWNDRHGPNVHSGRKYEYSGTAYAPTLEELEMEYKREAIDLAIIRDKEEDEENYKHRESIRELREAYMKKLVILRGMQTKQWEEFLQLDLRRQQQARQHMAASSLSGYNHPGYSDFERTTANPHFAGASLSTDARGRYPYPLDNYGEFQRPRREDYGDTYNRF